MPGPSIVRTWALPIVLLSIAVVSRGWLQIVSKTVPEPYLDEVFHVRQAQVYCSGAFRQWDPKITTPPGLYLVSYLLYLVTGRCDIAILRGLNTGAICLISLLSYDILRNIRKARANVAPEKDNNVQTILFDAHSALNISLFPPLFFFSALYYTDVVSTLCVLQSYNVLLEWQNEQSPNAVSALKTVLIGVVALFFRQTNIFWIAVFPAGLAVIHALGKATSPHWSSAKPTITEILQSSWNDDHIYDCSIRGASMHDCFAVLLSTAIVAIRKPITAVNVILPYLLLLGLFGGFVAWNGGVVLGDKSNHVATLHFPQMLYIWPYTIFFALPLSLVPLLDPIVDRLPEGQLKAFCRLHLTGTATAVVPHTITALSFLGFGLAAVHFNTIVHPFTLADNRHYVFYVFRILRRHPAIKYLAVPIYCACGWLAIQILGCASPRQGQAKSSRDRKSTGTNTEEEDDAPSQVSFILIWLATTALSVITAPLVEPRYFIIPWVLWRLHVPRVTAPSQGDTTTNVLWRGYDLRLVLETIWYLAINAVTAYMFLYRGFSWPQEPGNIQRFMW